MADFGFFDGCLQSLQQAVQEQALQQIIDGRYHLEAIHDGGGLGTIYLGRDMTLDGHPPRAVKLLRADTLVPAQVDRLLREAGALSHLAGLSQGIVEIHAAGRTPTGDPYIAMEFVRGTPIGAATAYNLGQYLKHCQRLPARHAAEIVYALSSAMDLVHSLRLPDESGARTVRIAHGDLKPENILLVTDERVSDPSQLKFRPKITDFGLGCGTAGYMAPEQAAACGEATPAADIWALGVILYQLTTGELPTTNRSRAGRVPRSDRLPSTGDPDLDEICEHCLRVNPAERYAAASALEGDSSGKNQARSELTQALDRWLRRLPLTGRLGRTRWRRRFVLACRRHPTRAAGTVATLLIALLSAGFSWSLAAKNVELTQRNTVISQQKAQVDQQRRAAVLLNTSLELRLAELTERMMTARLLMITSWSKHIASLGERFREKEGKAEFLGFDAETQKLISTLARPPLPLPGEKPKRSLDFELYNTLQNFLKLRLADDPAKSLPAIPGVLAQIRLLRESPDPTLEEAIPEEVRLPLAAVLELIVQKLRAEILLEDKRYSDAHTAASECFRAVEEYASFDPENQEYRYRLCQLLADAVRKIETEAPDSLQEWYDTIERCAKPLSPARRMEVYGWVLMSSLTRTNWMDKSSLERPEFQRIVGWMSELHDQGFFASLTEKSLGLCAAQLQNGVAFTIAGDGKRGFAAIAEALPLIATRLNQIHDMPSQGALIVAMQLKISLMYSGLLTITHYEDADLKRRIRRLDGQLNAVLKERGLGLDEIMETIEKATRDTETQFAKMRDAVPAFSSREIQKGHLKCLAPGADIFNQRLALQNSIPGVTPAERVMAARILAAGVRLHRSGKVTDISGPAADQLAEQSYAVFLGIGADLVTRGFWSGQLSREFADLINDEEQDSGAPQDPSPSGQDAQAP